MSLLTRCPVCDTLYRVVPDQLRISEGWVKCGQCGDIFDASKQLIEASTDDVPQVEDEVLTPPTDVSSLSLQELPELESPGMVEDESTRLLVDSASAMMPAEADSIPEPECLSGPVPEPESVSEPEPEPEQVSELCAPQESLQVRWDDPPLLQTPGQVSETEEFIEPVPVDFLTKENPQTRWQNPYFRILLGLLAGMLGVSLLGQWVVVERNLIAAQHPEFKPVLQTVCDWVRCQIEPLKQIESMSVDSVGFRQLDKETYRLSFVVKNASTLDLALPSVELVLTDAQDQPVYRRVFSIQELGSMETVIAANSEWSSNVVLHVLAPAHHERVLGYRLLIFYP
ncbi:MAG: putative Zinc finger/thioredoxin [Comamonadaceae bacterium]|nr:MAG: putative Zinc finger/thioredoxin [Comamonadaceae bacterium]